MTKESRQKGLWYSLFSCFTVNCWTGLERSDASEIVWCIAIQISIQGLQGLFVFYFVIFVIVTIGLSISSLGTKLQGVVVEIYPDKMGPLSMIRHQWSPMAFHSTCYMPELYNMT